MQILEHVLVLLEEVDGVEGGEEVTIHRLRTQAHRLLLERGIRLGLNLGAKDGGLGSGLERWVVRPPGIWLVEQVDSKPCRRCPEVASGLGMADEMAIGMQEPARAEALPVLGAVQGMRAQGLGRQLGDSTVRID